MRSRRTCQGSAEVLLSWREPLFLEHLLKARPLLPSAQTPLIRLEKVPLTPRSQFLGESGFLMPRSQRGWRFSFRSGRPLCGRDLGAPRVLWESFKSWSASSSRHEHQFATILGPSVHTAASEGLVRARCRWATRLTRPKAEKVGQ